MQITIKSYGLNKVAFEFFFRAKIEIFDFYANSILHLWKTLTLQKNAADFTNNEKKFAENDWKKQVFWPIQIQYFL